MLVFVVGSMAAMGLGLMVARITQPLRDTRLVVALLIVNLVVVPAAAIAAARLLPMEEVAATTGVPRPATPRAWACCWASAALCY